jgi:hypothetical protein
MVHPPEGRRLCCGLLCRAADSVRKRICRPALDQQLAPLAICHYARNSLLKFHHTRTNRLRVSQNAAALLFDFGTVDIR